VQVADKMGPFFQGVFLPTLTRLAQGGLTYDEIKALLKISSTWGAKIRGRKFAEGASNLKPK
jgi:hypothetical protein